MVDIESEMSREPGWRPRCIREIMELAESQGPLEATHEILARDNVTVTTSGEFEAIQKHPGGMLFVGNHSRQLEFVALMDTLHGIGRTSMKNIVKFYVENQSRWAFGSVGTEVTLPVYPKALDKDRKNWLNVELGSRILFRNSLHPAAESRRLTDITLQTAADELSQGGVINIFPCGRIVNNMKKPWREGVGRIIRLLPKEGWDSVLVVPYHADNINRARMVTALAARGKWVFGRPQNIEIVFGQTQTAADVIDRLPVSERDDPKAITEELRQIYVSSFAV